MRRFFAFAVSVLAFAVGPSVAQVYPDRPVRLVTPYGSGGATDILARTLGQELSKLWGQNVIVENRPGASGAMGTEFVARSEPNGYTLQLGTLTTHILNPILRPVKYDGLKDFVPVATLASSPYLLAVHPSLNVRTVDELIALAKANPGKLNYSSSGVGTANHLAAELFGAMAGIQITHVPYKGGTESVLALMRNDVQMLFDPLPSTILAQAAHGRVVPLATTGAQRSMAAPDLPTIAESGLRSFEVKSWFGILAPAGTPAPIVGQLARDIPAVMSDEKVIVRLKDLGTEPLDLRKEAFARMMQQDHETWTRVVRERAIAVGN